MKNIITWSLTIFVVTGMTILIIGSMQEESQNSTTQKASPTPTSEVIDATIPQITATASTSTKNLTAGEVASHNSPTDCWIIYDTKVYDITTALASHPSGYAMVVPYCGKDGAEGMETKDMPRAKDHTSYAYSWLDELYIGDLAN